MHPKNHHVQEDKIQLRALLPGELKPTEGEVPVCAFNKKHWATHEGTAPLRGEWFTCLPCAEAGRKGVGLNTDLQLPVRPT